MEKHFFVFGNDIYPLAVLCEKSDNRASQKDRVDFNCSKCIDCDGVYDASKRLS
jgi:hypothetical protein